MLSSIRIIPTKMKHKKLSENWIDAKPVVIEGMQFTSKYIGMTLVDSPKGEEMAAGAVKRIVTSNKASTKEPPLVMITVSPKGIVIQELATATTTLVNVDITRISYCTADKVFSKVFGYVAQNPDRDCFEFHAYMCGSRKEAQKIALTVAQSFSIAYEISNWKNEPDSVAEAAEPVTRSAGFSLESKKISTIYHSVADSRYKRLSDSFASNSGSVPIPADLTDSDNARKDKDIDVPSAFVLPSLQLSTDSSVQPSGSPTSVLSSASPPDVSTRKKSDDALVAILPPPSAKGRRTPRLATPTADLIDIPLAFERKSKAADEAEEIEFDFGQLALSRTKETV